MTTLDNTPTPDQHDGMHMPEQDRQPAQNPPDKETGHLASGQRLLLTALGSNVLVYIVNRDISLQYPVTFLLTALELLLVAGIGVFGLMRVHKGLAWSAQQKTLMLVLSLIPAVNLLVFSYARYSANRLLAERGQRIGLLGNTAAIPEHNHDLRNAFLCVFLLWVFATVGMMEISRVLFKNRPAEKEAPMAAFSPPDQRFVVSLPGIPTEADLRGLDKLVGKEDTKNIDLHIYELYSGNFSYTISHYTLPQVPDNIDVELDSLRDELVRQYQHPDVIVKNIEQDGHPGRNLRIIDLDILRVINIYIVGKTVYSLEAKGTKEQEQSPYCPPIFPRFI